MQSPKGSQTPSTTKSAIKNNLLSGSLKPNTQQAMRNLKIYSPNSTNPLLFLARSRQTAGQKCYSSLGKSNRKRAVSDKMSKTKRAQFHGNNKQPTRNIQLRHTTDQDETTQSSCQGHNQSTNKPIMI